jgi:hypothetical protein
MLESPPVRSRRWLRQLHTVLAYLFFLTITKEKESA